MCTNFQEHVYIGREDIRVALQTSDHKTLVFFLFFLISTDAQKAARILRHHFTRLCLLPKQPQVVVVLDKPFFFLIRFPKACSFVCA